MDVDYGGSLWGGELFVEIFVGFVGRFVGVYGFYATGFYGVIIVFLHGVYGILFLKEI